MGCGSDEKTGATGSAGSSGEGGTAVGGAGGSSGAAGGTGADGGTGATGGAVTTPELLSETGLYSDIASETLAAGVLEYQPAHELWSDGATKRRWVYFPEGAQIDTSDQGSVSGQDFWRYPVGTKAWKEFVRDDQRIETRLMWKLPSGEWFRMAYVWNTDGSDAVAAPEGMPNAFGTQHDVPDQETCADCHDMLQDNLLGVSALQLNHDRDGLTLSQLIADGRLTEPPTELPEAPGDATAKAALGYLHANCGNCHNPHSKHYVRANFGMWLEADMLSSVETTRTYVSGVGVLSNLGVPRIAPGDPTGSAIIQRMTSDDPEQRMPPVGTELQHQTGVELIESWISSLPPTD